MRNIAKCKLCESVIESVHASDYVYCKCGEIAVDGGDSLRCSAKDWKNFLRVDDEGNEIVVKVEENKPDKKQLIDMLDEMIKSYENLPQHVLYQPITHADLASSLLLISAILRADS